MANGVWHSGLQRTLELDKEDLGLGGAWPHLSELIESLLQPVAERDRELLVCVENSQGQRCKAELSGVKSPHMYVRKHRGPDGVLRLRAAHLPTAHQMTTEESDRHKAMKDFLARTGESAGLEVRVEATARNRTSRPDVTLNGPDGVRLGCEAQYYNASAGTVLRRSKAHADSGLIANWITHDDRFHLIDRSNWMLTREMSWKEISSAVDISLMGGFRVLVEWRCTAGAERPCPDARVKTGCGKMHLHWDSPRRLDDEGTGWTSHKGNTRGVTVGQTLIGAATGSVTPLFAASRKDRRSGAYMWVPADDKTRWTEYRAEEAAPPEEQQAPEEHIHFSGRDADTTCKFGDQTWVPSAPLERRGIYGVELTLTVDDLPPLRTHLPATGLPSGSASQAHRPATLGLPSQSDGRRPSLHEERAAQGTTSTNQSTHKIGTYAQKPQPLVSAQPSTAAVETTGAHTENTAVPDPPTLEHEPSGSGLPAELLALQRSADLEREKLYALHSEDERTCQRRAWFEAAATAQAAITHYARTAQLNRFGLEQEVRRAVRSDDDITM
ncbi:hypothetical protein WN979_31000 (plasmid) [Streptomyces albidoflavus]|uniref:competence protein CoiA family protein n=1 Tax=Streptomyces albidoflavus TaxID=1886 RepID=UPI0032560E30